MPSGINRNQTQRSFYSLFLVENSKEIFLPATATTNTNNSLVFRVPEHQRFYKWNLQQERLFIDSLVENYPIHSIITTTRIDATTSNPTFYYDIEDGQSRLTCAWKFANEHFAIIYNNEETTFKQLPPQIQTQISNYMIPFEEITFTTTLTRQNEQAIISEIFIRINYGKQLTHNDKYHACPHLPVMVVFKHVKDTFETEFREYCGKVGSESKSRPLLADFAAVILAISHASPSALITSFSENYHLLKIPINSVNLTRVTNFFTKYFNMLRSHDVNVKSLTKLSKFLGYCAYSFIHNDTEFTTDPSLIWYLNRVKQNKDFVPPTFTGLSPGSQRNCGPVPINDRLIAIQQAYNDRNQNNPHMVQSFNIETDDSD
jgi:hypothetical protein